MSGPAEHDASGADETPRPLRKDAARNRAALIDAARRVFAERGLEASMDDIARHAGVGVGTAYRHFANKHDLAAAIFAQTVDQVVDLAHRAAADPDPWAGLTVFVEGVATMQTVDRGLREVLNGYQPPEDRSEEVHERIGSLVTGLVDRAKAQGVLRGDADTSDIGMTVTMLCTVADLTSDVAPDLWRRYLPMLLAGLRAGGPDLPVPPIDEASMRTVMKSKHSRPSPG